MSTEQKSWGSATLRVKFGEHQIVFVQEVGKHLSPSDECLLYCIRCIQRSLGSLVGYHIPLLFETTRALPEHYDSMARNVCKVCEAFEILHPGLNEQLKQKLHNDSLTTRVSVYEAFIGVRNVIFQESVSWEKIIALFSFTGALITELVVQGNAEFAVNLLYYMKIFADNELLGWIKQNYGWVGMAAQFQSLGFERSYQPLSKGYISLLRTLLQQDLYQCTTTLALLLQEALLSSKYFISMPWPVKKKTSRAVKGCG